MRGGLSLTASRSCSSVGLSMWGWAFEVSIMPCRIKNGIRIVPEYAAPPRDMQVVASPASRSSSPSRDPELLHETDEVGHRVLEVPLQLLLLDQPEEVLTRQVIGHVVLEREPRRVWSHRFEEVP